LLKRQWSHGKCVAATATALGRFAGFRGPG